MSAVLPHWIQELRSVRPLEAYGEVQSHQGQCLIPLIGVGHYGGQIVRDLWNQLGREKGGRSCCWLDVVLPHERRRAVEGVFSLPDAQKIILDPDWMELKRLNAGDERWHYLNWYFETPDALRVQGRAALYQNLLRGPQSLIWKKLDRLLHGSGSASQVRVVAASWEDAVSGLLVDLLYLLEIIAGRTLNVELWLAGPQPENFYKGKRRYGKGEMRNAAIWTLRELGRYQRNERFVFRFGPEGTPLDKRIAEHGIAQRIFYYEGHEGHAKARQALVAVSGRGGEFFRNDLQNYLKDIGRVVERINEKSRGMGGVVSAIGASLLKDESTVVTYLTALYLTRSVFFGPDGLVPLESMSSDGFEEIEEDATINRAQREKIRSDAESFFRKNQNQRDVAKFLQGVAHEVMEYLNGFEGRSPGENRLAWSLKWAREVKLLARSATYERSFPAEVSRALDDLYDAITLVRQNAVQFVNQARKETEQILGSLTDEALEKMVWKDYRNRVGDPQVTGSFDSASVWYRLRRRLVWGIIPHMLGGRSAEWKVGAGLIPIPIENPLSWHQYIDGDFKTLWDKVLQIAYGATSDWGVPFDRLVSQALREYRAWYERARPAVGYVEIEAAPLMHSRVFLFSSKQREALDRLRRHLAQVEEVEVRTEIIPSLNGLALVLVEEPIPIHTLDLLQGQDEWITEAAAYVHRGEQIVHWGEQPGRLASPAFRSFVQMHEDWLLPLMQVWVLALSNSLLSEEDLREFKDEEALRRLIAQAPGLPEGEGEDMRPLVAAMKEVASKEVDVGGGKGSAVRGALKRYLRRFPRSARLRSKVVQKQIELFWREDEGLSQDGVNWSVLLRAAAVMLQKQTR